MKEERITVKKQIKRAFFALLAEKEYTDITISDLVIKAQVARMSFYRNFDSLDDVASSIANDILQDLINTLLPVLNENTEYKWRDYLFETFYRFVDMQKQLSAPFSELEKKHLNNNIIMSKVYDKISLIANDIPQNNLEQKYVVIGKISLIYGIIRRWAITGMQESPEVVIDLIISIIMKF